MKINFFFLSCGLMILVNTRVLWRELSFMGLFVRRAVFESLLGLLVLFPAAGPFPSRHSVSMGMAYQYPTP